jgi:DNA-binding transcriptional ArsR family regulator
MTAVDDLLDLRFAALADPTRRAILSRLARGEATVNEVAKPFDMTVQAVSRHLKVLERSGLVSRSRTAQFRPCRLEADALQPVADWVGRHREIWSDRLEQLDEHLQQLRSEGKLD